MTGFLRSKPNLRYISSFSYGSEAWGLNNSRSTPLLITVVAKPPSRSTAVEMVAVGEASGALDRMLQKIGNLYDKEVKAATRRLTLVLEPALVVFLGTVVGFVALAILLPMLKAVTSLQ